MKRVIESKKNDTSECIYKQNILIDLENGLMATSGERCGG